MSLELFLDASHNDMLWVKDTLTQAERYRGALAMIAGERDTWVNVDQARLVAQAVPSSELVVLDDLAHDFGRSVRRARQMFQTAAGVYLSTYAVDAVTQLPLDLIIRARQELRETGTTTVLDNAQ